jgi:hypothetical protein
MMTRLKRFNTVSPRLFRLLLKDKEAPAMKKITGISNNKMDIIGSFQKCRKVTA